MPENIEATLANMHALPRVDYGYRDAAPGQVQSRIAPRAPTECPPKCPACGGLECLCRPRFFAGQLLTEEDLTLLDRYIVGKNKLHNRYLHGWGVVCGLEVTCDACSGSLVRVRPGYALAPCGEDIVVCRDEQVNICQLIDACRTDGAPICDDPYYPPRQECPDSIESWVLAICYDERPVRGITPVTTDTDTTCCTKCSCGGSGSCSCQGCSGKGSTPPTGSGKSTCGCGGTASRPASSTSNARAKKPQCEPTQICEGYRFTAWRLPPAARAQDNNDSPLNKFGNAFEEAGPLYSRIFACLMAGLELVRAYPGPQNQNADAFAAYREYLEGLIEFASTHATHKCLLLQKLQQLQASVTITNVTKAEFDVLDAIGMELQTECWCSAFLPACPDPMPANCVPLALVTVKRGRECRVLEICNWKERKLAVSLQTIFYWLPKTLFKPLKDAIANFCCKPNQQLEYLAAAGTLSYMAKKQPVLSQPVVQPAAVAQPMGFAPAPAVVAAVGGVPPGAGPALAAAGSANQGPSFSDLLTRVVAGDDELYGKLLDVTSVGPLLALAHVSSAPDGMRASLLPMIAAAKGELRAPAKDHTAELAALREQLTHLGTQVETQRAELASLKKTRRRNR